MSEAGITVGISTLDRPAALARCLASLAAGAMHPDEIIVVDQAQGAEASEVAAEASRAGLRIEYVRQEGRGLGRSQNEIFRRARYAVVAVIDDDCVADARWLAAIVSAFAEGSVDAVAGRVMPMEPEGERRFPVSSRTSTERRDFTGPSLPWLVGSGNNFAVAREWLARIGGCDERLGPGSPARGGVDMDLFHRLLRAGARLRYEPDAIVHHERQTRAERLARRPMYGRGMGACVGLWLRQGDSHALRVLGAWLLLRTRLAAAALRRRDWLGVREELMMLRGTVGGLGHGLVVGGVRPPLSDAAGGAAGGAVR